jgi:hypothetical protein
MLYIAVLVVFLGTIFFVINQHISNKIDNENKLVDIVDKVNYNQDYSYDTLKKQQQQLYGINNDLQVTKRTYLKKVEAEESLDTRKLYANNVFIRNDLSFLNDTNLNLNKNKISFSNRTLNFDTDDLYIGSNIHFDNLNDSININGDLNVRNKTIFGENSFITESEFKGKSILNLNTGLNTSNLNVYENSWMNNSFVKSNQTVQGTMTMKGAKSSLNPLSYDTVFNDTKTNKNLIRGDTDFLGNMSNLGNFHVEKDTYMKGKSVFMDKVKVGHNMTSNNLQANISAYSAPNTIGATFGSVFFSHLPFSDGNTYIRPGDSNKSIYVGDVGNTTGIYLGTSNTNTNVKGRLQVDGLINIKNSMFISESNTILNNKTYTVSGANGSMYMMSNDGTVNINKDIFSTSIGRSINDNKVFGINTANLNNNAHPGTELVQGLSITKGGGLSIGTLQKTPEGNLTVRNTIKAGHNANGAELDQAPISTNASVGKMGAMFGGPDTWSYLSHSSGHTYLRPGKSNQGVYIGDVNTSNINIGTDLNTTSIGNKFSVGPTGTFLRSHPGKDLNIGDTTTTNINIGGTSSGPVKLMANQTFVKNTIDSWNTDKKLLAGWNSFNTIIGNPATGGSNYVNKIPANANASANDFYVYGKNTASTGLCVNNTCINEADLIKIKSWL